MGGAFQTSREIFKHPIWNDVIKFRLFFFIVGNAVFSDQGVRVGNLTLKRGQFLRSYRNLANDLEYLDNRSLKKYSISVLKKKVDQLVKENRLEIEDTELGTLFTVVNYAMYQGFDHYKNSTENRARTARERGENNNNKVNKDNKEKRYMDLSIHGNNLLNIYLKHYQGTFNKPHKKVSIDNYDLIIKALESFSELTDNEEFEQIVINHFQQVPKGNDGSILPFISAFRRYVDAFEIN